MKVIDRDNSAQVLDARGQLVASFPSHPEAKSFITGYKTGLKDAAERVSKRENELMQELRGMV